MAKSNIGGIFGFLRGSVGSGTYTTSTASIDGRRKQVVRQKVTNVNNPNTLAQIVQRMKMKPAHLIYDAFQKAAGSVENNPLSHSFEGVQYGNKTRLRFIQLAISGDPKAYVPKGVNFPVPGVYQVSEGSLPALPSGYSDNGIALAVVGEALDANQVTNLADYGVQVGDQITCLALLENNGIYKAGIARVIVATGNQWEILNNDTDMEEIKLLEAGVNADDTASGNVAAVAFILSRGTSSATAKRSTAFMSIMPDYQSLMSPEAYNAAVESYITNTTYNSLNSDWYLNQGSSQAFNGQVFFQSLNLPAIEGLEAETIIALLGRQSDGGSVGYVIFTSDGTSAGTVYARRPGGIATDTAWTASRAAAALGNVNITYAQYTDAIGAQAQGNV